MQRGAGAAAPPTMRGAGPGELVAVFAAVVRLLPGVALPLPPLLPHAAGSSALAISALRHSRRGMIRRE